MMTENYACGKGGFTIVWKIENFSHCLVKKGYSMESPSIKIPIFSGTWYVYFYPRGKNTATVECDLRKSSGDTRAIIDCLLCVCTSKGEIVYKNETVNLSYPSGGFDIKNIARFERNIFERLPDDTLVIHCHVWDHDSDRSEAPINCFVRSFLSIQRNVFYWKMDKFSTLQLREEYYFTLPEVVDNHPSLIFTLSLVGTNLEDASVQISLNFKGVSGETFFACALFIMDPNGRAKKYMNYECVLNARNHSISFYFLQRRELVTGYLSDDTLTIRGRVTFSGDYASSVEQMVYGLETREATVAATGPISDNPPSAFSADMLALFEGSGPASDFELRVEGRSFPVHQTVLGARSNVFRAMFDNDVSTKSAELTDLDADTAERLLEFAYADVEPQAGLAWEPLANLYSAAHRYEILALRSICALRLVLLLDPANAPRILRLADRHSDSALKEDVTNFILKRGRTVLESEQWKNLQKDDPNLVEETLQIMLCENVSVQTL